MPIKSPVKPFHRPFHGCRRSAARIAAILAVASSQPLIAANKFWDTNGGTTGLQAGGGTWDTGTTSRWSTSSAGTALTTWADDDTAFFQTAGANAVTLSGTIQALSVTQTTNSTATTLTGGTLQINGAGGIVNSGNAGFTINSAVTLNAATVTINAGNTITIGGNIGELGGPRNISKTGIGMLVLNGTNSFGSGTFTYGGGTTDSGTIRLGSATALGNYSTIDLAGNNTGENRIELTGGFTFAYDITTAGRADQQGIGAALISISGNNTWNGSITINATGGGYGIRADAGTLTLGGNLTGGVLSGQAARNFDIGGAGNVVLNGTISDSTGATPTLIGLTKFGAGSLTLTNANPYSNSTIVTQGTLAFNGANGAATSSSSYAVGAGVTAATILLNNDAGAGVSAGDNGNRLANTAGITFDAGTLELRGQNSAAAGAASSETVGALSLVGGGNTVRVASATAAQTTTTLTAASIARTAPATLVITTSAAGTLAGADQFIVTTPPALTNNVAAPYIINGTDNTFVTHGASGFANAAFTSASVAASGATDIVDQATQQSPGPGAVAYAVRLNAGALLDGNLTIRSGGLILNGTATHDSAFTFNDGTDDIEALVYASSGVTGTLGGTVSAARLTKFGSGAATLAGAVNLSAGGLSVNSGTLNVTGTVTAASTALSATAGGTLNFTGSLVTNSITPDAPLSLGPTVTVTASSGLTLTGNSLALTAGTNLIAPSVNVASGLTLTANGNVTASTLTKAGAGTLALPNGGKTGLANATIKVTAGTLNVGTLNAASVDNPLPTSVSLETSAGTTTNFFFNQTLANLTGSGVVQVGNTLSGNTARQLTVSNATANVFTGTLRDDGGGDDDLSFAKSGPGKFTFQSATVMIGRVVNVTGGELVYAGSTANSGSVSDRQRLLVSGGGTFTLDNTVTNNTNRIQLNSGTSSGGSYFVLASGTFNFLGSSGAASSEVFGTATALVAGQEPAFNAGADVINIVAGTGRSAIVMSERNIVRNAGSSVLIRGTNLGGTRGAADTATFAYNTSGPTLVGGGGAAGTTTVNIYRGVIADSVIGGVDTYGLATYDLGANAAVGGNDDIGVRRLAAAELESSITDGQTTLNNVRLTSAGSVATATTINSLHIDVGGSIDGAGTLTINSATVLAAGGANGGIGMATAGVLAFGANDAAFYTVSDLTVGSQITGTGGLTKGGGGKLVLSATNAYSGTTNVNSGTLVVDGVKSGTGAVAVNFGGTVGGSGSIAGALTISNGGGISPGSSPGSLTLTATGTALAMAAGATYTVELLSPAAGGYDQVVLAGTGPTSTATAALGSATLLLLNLAGSQFPEGTSFTIIDNNTTGGAVSGTFAGLPAGSTVFDNLGNPYTISYATNAGNAGGSNDVVLTAAVPEPAALGALSLLGIGLLSRRRRRRAVA